MKFPFNAENLPSGVYLYKLKAGNYYRYKKNAPPQVSGSKPVPPSFFVVPV